MESAKARGCPLRPEEPWEREVYKRGEADRRLILRQMVRRCGPPERWTWRPQSLWSVRASPSLQDPVLYADDNE